MGSPSTFGPGEAQQGSIQDSQPADVFVPRINPPAEEVRPFNFRQPSVLGAQPLRLLKTRQEEFAHELSLRFSIYLRMEFRAAVERIETLTFREFISSITSPSHLTLFKLEPLRGVGLLHLPTPVCVAIVERLLGGAGTIAAVPRDLTELETALLGQTEKIVLDEWCHHWKREQEIKPAILGHENNPRFVQTASPESLFLVIALQLQFGEASEQVRLAVPYSTIEPLIGKMAASAPHPPPSDVPSNWKPELAALPIALSVEWNSSPLSMQKLSELKVGDTVELDPVQSEQLMVKVAGLPRFTGRLGRMHAHWAVEITTTNPSQELQL